MGRFMMASHFGTMDLVTSLKPQRSVTERPALVPALIPAEQKLRIFLDHTFDGVVLTDITGRITLWSHGQELLTGIPAALALGRPVWEMQVQLAHPRLRTPEMMERLRRQILRTLATGEPFWPATPATQTIYDASGRRRTAEIVIFAAPTADGWLLGSFTRDITERAQAEQALSAREEQYRLILRTALDSFCLVDPNGRILDVNDAFVQLTGMSRPELLALTLDQLECGDKNNPFARRIRRLGAGQSDRFESCFRTATGQLIDIEISVNRPIEAEGRIILFLRDVTDRLAAERAIAHERAELVYRVKERTAELQAANEELARGGRLKDEFLANMSHELRTPLNAILSLTQLLEVQLAPLLDARRQRSLQTIAESGHHLLELIDEILDLTKIQAGKMTFHLENVAVDVICHSSLEIVKQAAELQEQSVSLEIAPGVTAVRADRLRLRQILVNLLSNAVKFTPARGAIGIEVHPAARPGFISFTVWDTGIGIGAEDIGRLFQPFSQLDSTLNREFEGSGLGLALAAQLARQQGGELRAVSRLGKGSRFTLTLPVATGSINAEPVRPVLEKGSHTPDVAGRLILLVEDNEANIFALSEYLEFKEYRVAVARTGLEALEMVRTVRPALVLMDVHLPRMDGLEVTRRIRAEADFKSLPILAVTALALADDRERCLAAGVTDYLAKPIDLERLDALLVHYLTSAPG